MEIIFREKEPAIELHGLTHLDQLIDAAAKQAKDQGILSIICLNADNGNSLSIVVGSDETVLSFTYGHQDPPYYASKGESDIDEPIMTCYFLFEHYTEFSRKQVIHITIGLMAVHEFYQSITLPTSIEWIEV